MEYGRATRRPRRAALAQARWQRRPREYLGSRARDTRAGRRDHTAVDGRTHPHRLPGRDRVVVRRCRPHAVLGGDRSLRPRARRPRARRELTTTRVPLTRIARGWSSRLTCRRAGKIMAPRPVLGSEGPAKGEEPIRWQWCWTRRRASSWTARTSRPWPR